MRILFTVGQRYLPQGTGGIEVNTDALAKALQRRSIEVAVITGIRPYGLRYLLNTLVRKTMQRAVVADRFGGYRVYRGWDTVIGLSEVLEDFRPDVVITQRDDRLALAQKVLQHRVDGYCYLHSATLADVRAPCPDGLPFLANSHFTAAWIGRHYGLHADVIPPLIQPSAYQVQTTRRHALFICPRVAKGVNIVLELAATRREVTFDLVESYDPHYTPADIRARARALPNVRWHKVSPSIRHVLRTARLLLVPSQCEETWGRVVSEAQCSGIPALASRVGGLPEAVGDGGVLIDDYTNVDAWKETFAQVWNDATQLERLADAALTHSRRPCFQPDAVVDSFLQAIGAAPATEALRRRPQLTR